MRRKIHFQFEEFWTKQEWCEDVFGDAWTIEVEGTCILKTERNQDSRSVGWPYKHGIRRFKTQWESTKANYQKTKTNGIMEKLYFDRRWSSLVVKLDFAK